MLLTSDGGDERSSAREPLTLQRHLFTSGRVSLRRAAFQISPQLVQRQ
jgi:hypothetical protein